MVLLEPKLEELLFLESAYGSKIASYSNNLPAPAALSTYEMHTIHLNEDISSDITVCIRTRPLLSHEIGQGHFTPLISNNPVLHALGLEKKYDGSTRVIPSKFEVDLCFSPDNSNDNVYNSTARPLIPLVLGGGIATVFCYGQTGSGKTFTMTGIEQGVADDIFKEALNYRKRTEKSWEREDSGFELNFSFFELYGNDCFDLLNSKSELKILEDKFGSIQLSGLTENILKNSNHMHDLIAKGSALRKTVATMKNSVSSRSHAICRIRIVNQLLSEAEDGILYLIDLAGSESSADSAKHDKERMLQTKEINKSLQVLKECIRCRALAVTSEKFIHIPFRTSKLTVLLKDAFSLSSPRNCRTVVIANIAPSIIDLKQSLNTLQYVGPLKMAPPAIPKLNPKDPSNWTHTAMQLWITTNSTKIIPSILCPIESGRQLLRLPESVFIQRCMDCGVGEKASKVFYLKLWKLMVDARTESRKAVLSTRNAKEYSDKLQDEIDRMLAASV